MTADHLWKEFKFMEGYKVSTKQILCGPGMPTLASNRSKIISIFQNVQKSLTYCYMLYACRMLVENFYRIFIYSL